MPETCPEFSLRHSGPGASGVPHPSVLSGLQSGCPTVFSPSAWLQPPWQILGEGYDFPQGPRSIDLSLCSTSRVGTEGPGVPTSLRQGCPSKNPQALSRSVIHTVEPRSRSHTTWTIHGWRRADPDFPLCPMLGGGAEPVRLWVGSRRRAGKQSWPPSPVTGAGRGDGVKDEVSFGRELVSKS